MADALVITGFLLIVVGVSLWSIPAACLVAGLLLCFTGAAMHRNAE